MQYDSYQYLWPPRPEKAVPNGMLEFYERQGWVGQIKKNGTCSLVFINGDETIHRNRHNESHKAWSPIDNGLSKFTKGWTVFVAELLHSKVPGIKDTLYVFDILVYDNQHLVGTTLIERHELLHSIMSFESEASEHYVVNEKLLLAKNFYNLSETWDALSNPEDEGIVAKNPNAMLENCLKDGLNSKWQVKCRKQHKNYAF